MSEHRLLEKLLDLPEFVITDLKHNEYDIRIYVSMKEKPSVCPLCGVYEPRLRVHSNRTQEVRDINMTNRRVGLMFKRKRYKCMECNEIFTEECKSIPNKGRMTTRLIEYIKTESEKRTFLSLQKELDISDSTIKNIFLEHIKDLPNYQTELETPMILGIDELFIQGKHRGVFVNGEQNTLMDFTRDRDKETIVAWLKRLKNPENVKIVTMDMWKPYRDAVYEALPNAYVVIDEYHVIKMANEALNTIRKAQKAKLTKKQNTTLKKDRYVLLKRPHKLNPTHIIYRDAWFSTLPVLKTAYDLKEGLFDMYKCKTKSEAIEYYENWKKSIPKDLKEFRDIAKTIDRLKVEVFNYFDGRVTNAIVEGLNNLIREHDRIGRGYDFEILRAKALFCLNHKVEKPKYATNTFSHMMYDSFNFSNDLPKDYGVPIKEYIKALNAGLFD